MRRVLVIKLGYRHGLAGELCRDVSLASVLRATVLLNLFDGDEVTWVTTGGATRLVEGARNVRKVLTYDHFVSLGLRQETFDVVVNLDADWEFCVLAQSVDARLRYGFTLDECGENVVALPGAEAALALELSPTARRNEARPDQQVLYEVMREDWQGEPLLLGYPATGIGTFDVGLDAWVAPSGANEAWPGSLWDELGELLPANCAVSRRAVGGSLKDYIHWLNSCRIVVAPDALGLYLALALGRKVVGLFGPTPAARCHTYGRGIKLTPSMKLHCIPCCDTECLYGKSCVETIRPQEVADAVEALAHADVLEN